ncbi:hypothetical protein JR316_0003761 [Psilocybe cubensis]|uniref:Uncharacterized protein n=2 Tax=Psilocybe cubensis TaxID=181762 RepID=A0ACB8HAV6_PSICU|nr:hypothetical protein JR316_0003761 [Psilocybe cubensis]KAH9484280.1 hypothetical protein JR316_0003761 [Psilocybe cubensis]
MSSNYFSTPCPIKRKVSISSLHLVVQSCDAALSGLVESVNVEDYPTSDFSILRTDFLSLLSIIYAATTKVALSLKPSEPHHKASLVPLRDLANNVAALVHSIRLMRLQEGSTIMAEYEKVAKSVIISVKGLAEALLQADPKAYLVRTGEIHELIDFARKAGGLSQNNFEAVRRLWLQEHDSLVDGYEEIQEICKKDSEDGNEDGEDALEDGWEEFGISSDKKLSPVEFERAEKVQAIVKLVILLHKRISRDTLSADGVKNDNSTLDKLSSLSNRLLTASDDLISSMYPYHDLANIKTCLISFWDIIKKLRVTILTSHDETLEGQLKDMSLSSGDKSKKWFSTCFDQIDITAAKIMDSLQQKTRTDS